MLPYGRVSAVGTNAYILFWICFDNQHGLQHRALCVACDCEVNPKHLSLHVLVKPKFSISMVFFGNFVWIFIAIGKAQELKFLSFLTFELLKYKDKMSAHISFYQENLGIEFEKKKKRTQTNS